MAAWVTIRGTMYDLDYLFDRQGNEYRICQGCHRMYQNFKGFDEWFHSEECMKSYMRRN